MPITRIADKNGAEETIRRLEGPSKPWRNAGKGKSERVAGFTRIRQVLVADSQPEAGLPG